MYNKSQFSKDRKLAKEPKKLAQPKDVDYVSKMGYRDDSPFNTRPYIDINTSNGLIDMSQTGTPLLANGRYLAPYSGLHQFDTNVVREVPLAEEGGTIMELTEDEIKQYRDAGYVVDLTPYPEKHNPANSFAVTDPRSMQNGGIKKYQDAGTATPPPATPPVPTEPTIEQIIRATIELEKGLPAYMEKNKPVDYSKMESVKKVDAPRYLNESITLPYGLGVYKKDNFELVPTPEGYVGLQPVMVNGKRFYVNTQKGSLYNKAYDQFTKDYMKVYKRDPMIGASEYYFNYTDPTRVATEESVPTMQDGGNFYTLKGSKAVYRKVGNNWEVDWNRSGNFQPISKGDVKERTANLNKNAQPLYDRDYSTMMGVKSEAPVPENPFTTNFVNKFGITDQAVRNAAAVAPTVENAQKLDRLTQQKAYEDALRQQEIAARQRENELLEQSKFTNIPLSQVSDNTQMYTDDVERQAIAGAPAVREMKRRQAEFEKQQWEKYNKMSTWERIMDRSKGFMVDPLGMTSRALMGEQGYIPGMGEGLLNKDDPNYYNYLIAAGYKPGEFDMFDVQSMVNPMYWGASMGNNINKGNYLDAGIEAALTFAPMVPKGSISQGARMLGDDMSRGVNYLTTKTPKQLPGSPNAPGLAMLTLPSGSNFTKEIKNIDYYSQLLNTFNSKVLSPTNKKFYTDLINTVKNQNGFLTEAQYNELQRLKTGNFDFGKRGYNYPKQPLKAGFDSNFITRPLTPFTKNELTPGENLWYRKIGNEKGLLDLIKKQGAQAPKPMKMKSGLVLDAPFFGVGSKPTESYKGLYAVELKPEARKKYSMKSRVAGVDNYGSVPFLNDELVQKVPLEDLNVYRKKWFSNNYKKLNPDNLEEGLKNAAMQRNIETLYKWAARVGIADQLFNNGNYRKTLLNNLNNNQNNSTSQKSKGGYVSKQMTHFQDGGNTDPGNNALELHMFYDKNNIKAEGGTVLELTDEEIKRYRDAGYIIVED